MPWTHEETKNVTVEKDYISNIAIGAGDLYIEFITNHTLYISILH